MKIVIKLLDSFEIASKCAAVICFILFFSWHFFPKLLFIIFDMETGQLAYFLGRRIAALFIALGIILFFLSREKGHRIQKTLAVSFAIACFLLAISGVLAFKNNIAGIGIWVAIIVELFFCFWFLFSTRKIDFSLLLKA